MASTTLSPIHAFEPVADDKPDREIAITLYGIVGFFCAVLLWACLARLDAAVTASGIVRVAGDHQAVQPAQSGVVASLRVHEGQHVTAGQNLVDFTDNSSVAQEHSLATRAIDLQAEIARLTAQTGGSATLAEPGSFAGLEGFDRAEAVRAMALARTAFDAWQAAHVNEKAIFENRARQIDAQIHGAADQRAATLRQRALLQQQLSSLERLAAEGWAPKTKVIELQRSAAALDGDSGAQSSEMARLSNAVGESHLTLIQLRQQQADKDSDLLRSDQAELQSVLPQWQAAQQALQRLTVRAPVTGTIMGLSVHGPGEVFSAGQKLLDLVPDNRSLLIEAQIAADQAASLKPGQAVMVRAAGIKDRSNPSLAGTVKRVSADSFTDDKSGRAYYTVAFVVAPNELERLHAITGGSYAYRPGAAMSVEIPLRRRSALRYWLEPLTQAFDHAGEEQ